MEGWKSYYQCHAILVLLLVVNGIMSENSTEETTENLFTSNQFIGITAGLGTFLFIGVYLYFLWKCTCGSPDDDEEDKQNRVDAIENRE